VISLGGELIPIIDAHVHVFPEDIGRDRASWLLRDEWFNSLYQNPKSRLASVEDLIESMDASSIDRSILCGFPWSDNAHCTYHNEYMADSVRRFPDRLAWLGIVAPGDQAAPSAEVCFTAGAVGIGELNADAQGFAWTASSLLEPLVRVAEAYDRPLMIHSSEPLGHDYPGKGKATPDHLLSFAELFPTLKIVAAHWGGGLPFFELMPEVRRSLTNLAYDSAATTFLYEHAVFEHVMNICGAEKVIFSSDYPVLRQDRLMTRMMTINWPSVDAARLVMSANAVQIYGLDRQS
jgi:predicted TIM-barrel fold metal-dependent hydrolase